MHQSIQKYPKINYKKLNIIFGLNASGKTTFTKTMRFINNYICGIELDNANKQMIKQMCKFNEKNKINTYFEVIFYHEDYMYYLKSEFDGMGYNMKN